ncbi:MAG: RHS repeat protein, partial [Verrucomicrobiae bacterium]|nr:RHS repeat protein [Verrucomicrobiae bacterium]
MLKSNKTGDPFAKSGITISTSHVEYATADALIWSPRSNYGGVDDDCDGFARAAGGGRPKGWDGTVKGSTRLAGGDDTDEDCDGTTDEPDEALASTIYGATVHQPVRDCGLDARLTRLTTSHGQSFTWTYDAAGNCTSATTPISGGAVYVYDTQGRLTSSTISNGADGDFHDELAYGSDGFLHTYTEDATPGGRNLTSTFEYDTLGRCTRIVDPMTDDWLLTWNALDVCTQTESPPVAGERIATDFAYDASGRLARCDVQLRDSFGNVPPTNASYSTFWVYDFRGRLSQVATEERPTDTTGLLEPDPLTLENFAVTDFTYDNAGQVIRASTPAVCRGQSTDEVVDLTYDERGLLHHVVAGGLGTPGAVTIEYDYDTLGACVREACLAPDGDETLYAYDAFHRPASVTDAMGNEAVFTYDEAGRVTTSFYGETEDLPGDSGNVLLARTTVNNGNNENWNFGGPNSLRGRFIARGIKAEVRRLVETSRYRKKDDGREYTMPTFARACPPDRPVRCMDGTCAAFFAVYQEDDVIETERFGPADSPPFAVETTVLDRSPAGLLMNVTRNGDQLASYGYDTSGALTSISNAARTVTFGRDNRQNTNLCGTTDHFRVASPPAPKTFSHTITRDSLGRITAVTDGAGNASAYEYDSLGRVTLATSPGRPPHVFAWDSADVAGPYSVLVSCDIDNSGSLTELGRTLVRCGSLVQSADSNGYSRTYTYDSLGRPTRCDLPDGTYESTTYDARGFIVSGRFSDGSSLDITSDRLGRVLVVTPVNDPPTVIPSPPTSYTYDGLGRLVSATQGASTVTMTWDSVGNPTSET